MAKLDEVDFEKFSNSSKVITVTSGKGGVGKSNLVSNLAISFANLGKKVVIVDADLGLANIEVLFGIIPKKNLSHVLKDNLSIQEALTEGPLGIKFLSGGSGIRELSKISNRDQKRVIDSFSYLDKEFDIILIDTGAGISEIVVNFVKVANEIVVITTPEPTSITDAYALIKIIKDELESDVVVNLVVNKVNNYDEGLEVYNKLLTVTQQFLDANLHSLGFLPIDQNLVTAVKKQKPTSLMFPDTDYSKSINSISKKILKIELPSDNINEEKEPFSTKILKFFGRK